MSEQIVEVMIEGGKASAGPPIGTSLGPLKINVANVVEQINEKTKEMAGMQVPVKITVDTDTKDFEIGVGKPPASALIKKELGIEKGSGEAGTERAGDLTEEQAKKIARVKFGSDDEHFTSQIKGTCRSMGITIGEGAVTEEELKKYEQAKKAKEEAEKAKEEAKAAEAGEAGEAGAKPEEGAEEKAGEEKPEGSEEKPKEGEKPKENA
jgi:large subunit ribosomal protein L11